MNIEYQLIKLPSGDKWAIIAEAIYNGGKYRLLLRVNDAEDNIIEEFNIMRVYHKDGTDYYDELKPSELTKELLILLVPEAREHIDDSKNLEEIVKGIDLGEIIK